MKKLVLSVIMSLVISTGLFAQQICKSFDTRKQSTIEIKREIQGYLDKGWKVVSMVSVSNCRDGIISHGLSTSILVVFEIGD